jgi:hypothetical protein
VEVLIKYGLAAKAIEQLEGLSERFPDSPQVHARLRDLYQEGGNAGKAVEHVLALAALYDREGMSGRAEMALRAALEMFPESTAIQARLGLVPAAAAEAAEMPPVFRRFADRRLAFQSSAPRTTAPVLNLETLIWAVWMRTLSHGRFYRSARGDRAGSAELPERS